MLPVARGRLLVASPRLLDPNFYRAVVLMIDHGVDGSLGVVLNRPTEEPVSHHLPRWADAASQPPVVFIGGPVSNDVAVGVVEGPVTNAEAWTPVLGPIGMTDLAFDPDEVGGVTRARVYSGYSGWEAGQLDAELESGSWFVVDAWPDDVFTRSPDRLWDDVLRRQPSNMSLYAHFPHDPSHN